MLQPLGHEPCNSTNKSCFPSLYVLAFAASKIQESVSTTFNKAKQAQAKSSLRPLLSKRQEATASTRQASPQRPSSKLNHKASPFSKDTQPRKTSHFSKHVHSQKTSSTPQPILTRSIHKLLQHSSPYTNSLHLRTFRIVSLKPSQSSSPTDHPQTRPTTPSSRRPSPQPPSQPPSPPSPPSVSNHTYQSPSHGYP